MIANINNTFVHPVRKAAWKSLSKQSSKSKTSSKSTKLKKPSELLPHEMFREKELDLSEHGGAYEYDVMKMAKKHGTEAERKEKYKKCLKYEREKILVETKGYIPEKSTEVLSMMYCQYLYYADLVVPETKKAIRKLVGDDTFE